MACESFIGGQNYFQAVPARGLPRSAAPDFNKKAGARPAFS